MIKMLMLRDENGEYLAVQVKHITDVTAGLDVNSYKEVGKKIASSNITFVGGGCVRVLGTVEEVAQAIRLHRSKR